MTCRTKTSSARPVITPILTKALALATLFGALSLPTPASPEELRLAFQESKLLDAILVTIQINGKPAILIFDTGSNSTILSPEISGASTAPSQFDVSFPESRTSSEAHWGQVRLEISGHQWKKRRVVVQDQHNLYRVFGQKIDGILGKDLLNEFQSVTIDFKSHSILFKK